MVQRPGQVTVTQCHGQLRHQSSYVTRCHSLAACSTECGVTAGDVVTLFTDRHGDRDRDRDSEWCGPGGTGPRNGQSHGGMSGALRPGSLARRRAGCCGAPITPPMTVRAPESPAAASFMRDSPPRGGAGKPVPTQSESRPVNHGRWLPEHPGPNRSGRPGARAELSTCRGSGLRALR